MYEYTRATYERTAQTELQSHTRFLHCSGLENCHVLRSIDKTLRARDSDLQDWARNLKRRQKRELKKTGDQSEVSIRWRFISLLYHEYCYDVNDLSGSARYDIWI